jgi:putative ABC transport system permease protein
LLRSGNSDLAYVSQAAIRWFIVGANNVTRNERTGAFEISGDYPGISIGSLWILRWTFINYSDIDNDLKTAVIGVDVSRHYMTLMKEPIGSYFTISSVSFKVVGVKTLTVLAIVSKKLTRYISLIPLSRKRLIQE